MLTALTLCLLPSQERANNTDFGLGGSVWTNDLERGNELAAKIQSGVRGVNAHPGGGKAQPRQCPCCRPTTSFPASMLWAREESFWERSQELRPCAVACRQGRARRSAV